MKAPSGRLLLVVGAVLTLVSGVLLALAVATTSSGGGPFGFLATIYPICILPGIVLVASAFILYARRSQERPAAILALAGAMASIPFSLAGFWVGFVMVIVGSLLILARTDGGQSVGRTSVENPASLSARTNRRPPRSWVTPAVIVLVGLTMILLLCPQVLSADATTVGDLVNDPVAYDLQAGFVFGSGGSSFSYEVDAISQSPDCELGFTYLVNAYTSVSGQLYWYQAGLSYDWGGGFLSSSGWGLTYEVFGPNGASIYPGLDSGAGVATFSGPVGRGDPVLVTLVLEDGDVTFSAVDQTTHASASESYSSAGAQTFGGEMPPQNPGYFTGLMTECYRNVPNNVQMSTVTYTDEGTPQSEGAVFVDELDLSAGRFPYLPSVELAEEHSTPMALGLGTSSYEAYGVAIGYGSSTFVTGSG
ncbi:MAG: hypothetical protein WA547_01690 [Thermoplasmata archaeon]